MGQHWSIGTVAVRQGREAGWRGPNEGMSCSMTSTETWLHGITAASGSGEAAVMAAVRVAARITYEKQTTL